MVAKIHLLAALFVSNSHHTPRDNWASERCAEKVYILTESISLAENQYNPVQTS